MKVVILPRNPANNKATARDESQANRLVKVVAGSNLFPMNSEKLQTILNTLEGVKQLSEDKYQACCPAHDDNKPSLSISEGADGRILLFCHRGCEITEILQALNLEYKDLYLTNGQAKLAKPVRVQQSYDYTDKNGKQLYQVRRYSDKSFSQHKADGNGGWMNKLYGARKVLYQLPQLANASSESFIYICEGEKDVDRLIGEGLFATTNSGGASNWGKTDSTPLHDHHIILLEDNDLAGRKRVGDLAVKIIDVVKSVRILVLPDLPKNGGDVSDWLDKGGDTEELDTLASKTPIWEPTNNKTGKEDPVSGIELTVRDSQLHSVCMADVQPERVKWLWRNRFPLGKLSIIAGVQGLGKTFAVLDMAARISTGRGWPDEPDQPIKLGSTILLSLEDGLGDTLRPRLDASGADVNKIYVVKSVQAADEAGDRTFCVSRDIFLLEQLIDDIGDVRLVIVDPLTGYIGGDTDIYRDNDVRAALSPLGDLAARTGVAIIGIMHLRKSKSDHAMFRVLGSVAFTAYARACWLIGEDREDPEYRLMLPAKLNVAKAAPGLKFQIVEPGRVKWDDQPVHITANEAFAGSAEHSDEASPKVAAAMDWLKTALANGLRPAKELKKEARENCIAERTLERAKSRLNVIATKESAFGSAWHWTLQND